MRGLGRQVAWAVWLGFVGSGGARETGGPRARATERRLASAVGVACRAAQTRRQPTPLRCAPGPHSTARGGVRLSRRSVRTRENGMKNQGVPEKYRVWVDTRKRFKLSHAQIQMARELGLNPEKFGSLANSDQEPWKAPLGEFIEELYQKHFRKAAPDVVRSIEDMVKAEKTKKELRKVRKQTKAAEPEARTEDDKEPGCEPAPPPDWR